MTLSENACLRCYTKKWVCDRKTPCATCTRSGTPCQPRTGKKTGRVPKNCGPCYSGKAKCDRGRPCDTCTRLLRTCTYPDGTSIPPSTAQPPTTEGSLQEGRVQQGSTAGTQVCASYLLSENSILIYRSQRSSKQTRAQLKSRSSGFSSFETMRLLLTSKHPCTSKCQHHANDLNVQSGPRPK